MPETTQTKDVIAVIEVGSSAIRMVVAELGPKLAIHYLENLQKPVALGKDVFTTGRLNHGTMRQAIEILTNFKSVLEGYNVKNLHAIATSAVREAANRESFIDQVFVRTGIDVEVIEGAEENRLDLIAVEDALQGRFEFDKKNCLIIEVGTGSTEITLTTKGEVSLTRTLAIGPIRLPEQAAVDKTDSSALQRLLKRHVHAMADGLRREYNLAEIDSFIAMGSSMRFLAKQLHEQNGDKLSVLDPKEFSEFVKSLFKLSTEEIADKYTLPYADAEALTPSLLIYANFLTETQAAQILVPTVSIRDGLLLEMSQLVSGYRRTDLSRQVIHSARSLGKKYRYDEPHATLVAQSALKLFDLLKEDHGLGPRERLLLEVAGLLHDIGIFISPSSHHKHSFYLINAAEVFGLRKTDKDIVANVARYHRRSVPKPTHIPYMSLPRADRAVVSKLAAILRIAEALDASHQQKLKDFTLERYRDTYTLWIPEEAGDISMERQSLARKSDLFADVFGATILLKQGAPAPAKT
jgi:exopolyphosphatase/guanosine-5'-triphosphate,3'-diphosphate pyrophosphatase